MIQFSPEVTHYKWVIGLSDFGVVELEGASLYLSLLNEKKKLFD